MAKVNKPGSGKASILTQLEQRKEKKDVISDDSAIEALKNVQKEISDGVVSIERAAESSIEKTEPVQPLFNIEDKSRKKKIDRYMVKNPEMKEDTQVSIKIAGSLHRALSATVSTYNTVNRTKTPIFLQDLINNILNDWKEKNKEEIRQLKIEAIDIQ